MNPSAMILFSVVCFLVKASSVENIYSENGWRPMLNEKLIALQRNFIRTPSNVIQNVPGNSMDIIQRGNAMKIVDPIHHNKESIKDHEAIFSLGKKIEKNEKTFEDSAKPSYVDIAQEVHINSNQPRKAKKIAESDDNLLSNNVIHDSIDINEFKEENKNNERISQRDNTYEVNENSEQEDLTDDYHDLKPRNSNGYKYEVQRETKPHNNLTSNLLNILANYNIRSGDKLPNYALSLRQNSRKSNNFVYMHIPIKIPYGYNSENHIPIDPLLAVFLSNYGFYLPGSYGFSRSYNNLYGYLASNNIHNNKPFGSYKVFSDTDTSY